MKHSSRKMRSFFLKNYLHFFIYTFYTFYTFLHFFSLFYTFFLLQPFTLIRYLHFCTIYTLHLLQSVSERHLLETLQHSYETFFSKIAVFSLKIIYTFLSTLSAFFTLFYTFYTFFLLQPFTLIRYIHFCAIYTLHLLQSVSERHLIETLQHSYVTFYSKNA